MRNLVIFINVLFTFIALISIVLALTSVMLFDSPGSEQNAYLWITCGSALALPFTSFGFLIYSWGVFFRSHHYKKALWAALIPCINITTLIVSLVLIQIFCQGSFSCQHS